MADEELIRQMQKSIEQLTEEVRSLKEQLAAQQGRVSPGFVIPYTSEEKGIPAPCQHCPNHPSNGGSGVCFCILGTPTIT